MSNEKSKEQSRDDKLLAKQLTLGEIGDCMNLTRERVRQIEMNAIRKLRHKLRNKGIYKVKDIL